MYNEDLNSLACQYALRSLAQGILDEAKAKVVAVEEDTAVVEIHWAGTEWIEKVPFALGYNNKED